MKTALVTGASSGIGATFAQKLAQKNYNLVLVARSQDKLKKLALELGDKYQIDTEIIVQDLTEVSGGQKVFDAVQAKEIQIDLLINNAGFGDYGEFVRRPLSKQISMVNLNVSAVVELTGLFLPLMQKRKEGAIINVASTVGFQPIPYMSVYAATKAFVLSFSEALWAENKETGVNILATCPGPTESKFFERADFPTSAKNLKGTSVASSEKVVEETLQALEKRQSNVVAGGLANRIIVNLHRFVPRDLFVNMIGKQFKSI